MDELKITVDKTELITKVTTNRDAHRDIFEDAMTGWEAAMLADLEGRIAKVRAHKPVDLYIRLTRPEDHTTDYNRVIAMLEMHQQTSVEITSQDFAQYVMDDWDWKRAWIDNASTYSAKAR